MQTINVEPKVPISLNRIIEHILDNLAEETPAFIRECDRKVEQELHNYTKKVIESIQNNKPVVSPDEKVPETVKTKAPELLDKQVAEAVETKAPELLDVICEARSAYLEAGVHIGANLLWQLLDI